MQHCSNINYVGGGDDAVYLESTSLTLNLFNVFNIITLNGFNVLNTNEIISLPDFSL